MNPNQYLCRIVRKPGNMVSDHVQHKPGCTATGHSYRLEISGLEGRGNYYLHVSSKNIKALIGTADLPLCFYICKNQVFS